MKYHFNILDSKSVFNGYHKVELITFNFEKFAGDTSPNISREILIRKPCVGLLPYDPARDEVILIEQIRVGPLYNNHTKPWLYEIVAGIVEENEDSKETVLRESKEEANCIISKIIPIYEYYVTPGCSSETIQLYCGITDTSNAGGIYGIADEGEDIKVHVISFNEALKMLESGEIINAASIVALQWLALNKNNLKNII